MEFNPLVKEVLFPVLTAYGFSIAEDFRHVVRFKSAAVKLSISHDWLDCTGLLEAGQRDGFLYPLDDELIKNVFDSSIKIDQVTRDTFVQNVAIFLGGDGSAILRGDRIIFEQIRKFVEKKSESYTAKLVQKQILQQVDNAWADGQYAEFVRLIDQLNKEDLPQSYQLKYKIAIKRG